MLGMETHQMNKPQAVKGITFIIGLRFFLWFDLASIYGFLSRTVTHYKNGSLSQDIMGRSFVNLGPWFSLFPTTSIAPGARRRETPYAHRLGCL